MGYIKKGGSHAEKANENRAHTVGQGGPGFSLPETAGSRKGQNYAQGTLKGRERGGDHPLVGEESPPPGIFYFFKNCFASFTASGCFFIQ